MIKAKKTAKRLPLAAACDYRRELHRYLLRRLHNPHDVDDLAQEVYLRLLRVDDETLVRKPLAFVYAVASHVVAEFWRSGTEDNHVEKDPLEQWSEDLSLALPDDLAERLSLEQQLDRALAQLPPMQAAVLLAHKRDGLSYEETAEKLGISVHTVEKYLTKAKARMRALLWER
jgi:RNA polymerase sigma-70 factor (ECF subfamily)